MNSQTISSPHHSPSPAESPLFIDLTFEVRPVSDAPLGQGTARNPSGHTITADSRSFFFDGVACIPVCGEFQYSRYRHEEWRDQLLKMKAGGIDVVSTYVFWIHHEEERGKFDWGGDRSLRGFLELCGELNLKVFARIGPWCHGEVRNGGFPDWVRAVAIYGSTDPAFLALTTPLYAEIARQMVGLLWKDGGPVIGIQLDNECNNPEYLLALKKIARDLGIDVPLYTMTGWNQVTIPQEGLLPLFGGYVDGFWSGGRESCRTSFVFTNVRDPGDLGAQMQNVRPSRNEHMESFPYACAEIGPGMLSSYHVRVKIQPHDAAAMAMVKLGSGNNLPGYYVYQGGTNPEGKLTTLHENEPNVVPVKDYDFQTALGAAGQVRDQFHLLREQHLFLQDHGSALARMPAYFPEKQPENLNDADTLRWSARADDAGRGFIFFNNRDSVLEMPEKRNVQFELKTATGSLLVPQYPLTIGPGAYGFWPFGLDCMGVVLEYATAQPLCHVEDEDGSVVYFFVAIEGVLPELAFKDGGVHAVTPGTGRAVTLQTPDGKMVSFVVLTPEQGREFYRLPFAGRQRAILSKATIFADGPDLRLQANSSGDLGIGIFPSRLSPKISGTSPKASIDGIFVHFVPHAVAEAEPVNIGVELEKHASPHLAILQGAEEATWQEAAIYRLDIPDCAGRRHLVLDVHYIGDAARLYIGDTLFLDNFYNGDAMSIPLWRIHPGEWKKLRLKILPFTEALPDRLPHQAKRQVAEAKAAGSLDKVIVNPVEQFEVRMTPGR